VSKRPRKTSLKKEVERIAHSLGYSGTSALLNEHIIEGGTFKTFKIFLEKYKIYSCYANVWKELRNFLTVPYDFEDAFHYKWNLRARQKGFKDAKQMFSTFRRKGLVPWQLAQELGLKKGEQARKVMLRFEGYQGLRKWKRRCHLGFIRPSKREWWNQKAQEFGFKNIRNCVRSFKKKGRTVRWMAKKFGVSEDHMGKLIKRVELGKKYKD